MFYYGDCLLQNDVSSQGELWVNFSQPKNKCSSFISNTLFKMGATGFGLCFSVIIIEAAGAIGDSRK